jgi:hypothetical protein
MKSLEPGPIGQRFAVIDYDGANKTFISPSISTIQNCWLGGMAPNEFRSAIHQQMVYAVASETLQRSAYALAAEFIAESTARGAPSIPRGSSKV